MAEHVTITCYTTDKRKDALLADVRRTSVEEVPEVIFIAVNGISKELRDYIDGTLT